MAAAPVLAGVGMDGRTMKTFKVLSAVLLALASACGEIHEERATAAELTGGRAGEVALIPTVEVDGLEELTDRSEGTVFVEEVIMHAQSVRLLDTQGQARNLRGSNRYFLRYSPAAGEAGLSRLWAPADGQFTDLAIDVGPIHLSEATIRDESRARGFDLTDLNEASVLIRGVITVGGGSQRTLMHTMSGGEGCGPHGDGCDRTVPDGAPAKGGIHPERAESMALAETSTVPDGAPARGEVANAKQGLTPAGELGGLPGREFRSFVMVSNSALSLGTTLDPVVAQGGGMVRLHLDVNQLLSDARIAELREAAALETDTRVLSRRLEHDEVTKSFHVQAGEVATVRGPSNPR